MLLSAVIILMSLLFVFCVRKHKKILSALIAIETVVLIAMLAVTYLSAAGNETATIFILAKAISTKVTLFGVSVSSLMLIQAIVVLFACVVLLYGVFRIVKEVCKAGSKITNNLPNDDVILLNPVQYITRKVFMLYCRMNN